MLTTDQVFWKAVATRRCSRWSGRSSTCSAACCWPWAVRPGAIRPDVARHVVTAGAHALCGGRRHLGVDLRLRLGAGQRAALGGAGRVRAVLARRPTTALWAVLAAHLWKWLGFNMIVFLAALYALPGEVLGAAELDNCGWWPSSSTSSCRCCGRRWSTCGAVVHRQDDGLRPGLDHDRRRTSVVDRDGVDLCLQARVRLEHLRPRLPVGHGGAVVHHDPRLRRDDERLLRQRERMEF